MLKRILFLLVTLLFVLAQANIAAATSSHGFQPPVPEALKK